MDKNLTFFNNLVGSIESWTTLKEHISRVCSINNPSTENILKNITLTIVSKKVTGELVDNQSTLGGDPSGAYLVAQNEYFIEQSLKIRDRNSNFCFKKKHYSNILYLLLVVSPIIN